MPRAAHHYSSLPGGGEVEPMFDAAPGEGSGSMKVERARESKRLQQLVAAEQELDPEGELPAGNGPVAPAWLARLDRPTLDLMEALQEAQPWATGLRPVRRVVAKVPGEGVEAAEAAGLFGGLISANGVWVPEYLRLRKKGAPAPGDGEAGKGKGGGDDAAAAAPAESAKAAGPAEAAGAASPAEAAGAASPAAAAPDGTAAGGTGAATAAAMEIDVHPPAQAGDGSRAPAAGHGRVATAVGGGGGGCALATGVAPAAAPVAAAAPGASAGTAAALPGAFQYNWDVLPGPEPLSPDMLLALALLVQEAARG
ncbi:hypothetical protein GPECTOR_4g748 [Gonium pectorale]|uniref:Uncharacterized protein n=1 Tax=Gonium pectorale TaxID=33097 RepID=A0A150GY98_GONPE|nr:hypothetical protein GPECTOR_4g748 [Gonium pectorale]|eukprot:KXZ54682.1 hypothetical protein GPECTOR_4g748 [Gonium pectorale]